MRRAGVDILDLPGADLGWFGLDAELKTHSPDHRARVSVPYEYLPGAEPLGFIRFLHQLWRDQEDAEDNPPVGLHARDQNGLLSHGF